MNSEQKTLLAVCAVAAAFGLVELALLAQIAQRRRQAPRVIVLDLREPAEPAAPEGGTE